MIIFQGAAVAAAAEVNDRRDKPLQTVQPSKQPLQTIRIFDWIGRSDGEAITVDELEDPAFKGLVSRLSSRTFEYITHKGATSVGEINIIYVRDPFVKNLAQEGTARTYAQIRQDVGKLRLESPWSEVYVDEVKRKATVIFRFSDRQSLIDRVVRETGLDASQWDASPLDQDTFDHYAQTYADSVVTPPAGATKQGAVDHLKTTLPPDIFWLFQHSPQSTRGPFSGGAKATVAQVVNAEIPNYEQRVVNLVFDAIAGRGKTAIFKTEADTK